MTEYITEDEIIEKVQKEADDVTYREIKDPYGFIYITTNLINGKRYLGQKIFDEKWKGYLGSGVVLRAAIKKYGKENFSRNIINICYSADELNSIEYELSVFFDVVESDDWYNVVYGGGSTPGLRHTDETKQKLREYNLGKERPQEVKEKIGQSMSRVLRGRAFSNEHKQHISEARLGLKNPGCRTVYCIELDEIFWGAKAAENKYKIDNGSICKCCRGKCKTIGKHPISGISLRWKYVDDFIKDDGSVLPGAITLGYITETQVNDYLNNLR